MTATGASHKDVFQNMMTYGLFTGGLGLHYGAELMGMTVIPAGAGNTRRQIQLMQDFKTTAVHATPSYLLHVGLEMEKLGLDPQSLCLKKAFVGAEPHSEALRKRIEAVFNIDAYNSYGLCEMNGPGVAFECGCKNGMHLWEDAYLLEIIDPETLSPVPEGETGELVLTTLCRAATPLLRYRTRDLTRILPGPCPCGRTHRRIARIKGRSDDMMIINGVNVFPSQVESALMAVPGAGANYRIRLEKKGALDVMALDVEVSGSFLSGDRRTLEALKDRIREAVKSAVGVNPEIELLPPGGLPAPAGKAVRVKDNRRD
jgi:phenylacetate-CoA ligase